jgi:hypothetical protein
MNAPKLESLPVIFRAERAGLFKGAVTAVFPTLPGTCEPNSVTIYAHVGQHGTGSFGWYARTRAAKPAEYASLLAELRGIYEDPDREPVTLQVRHKWTQAHDQARRAELRRIEGAGR